MSERTPRPRTVRRDASIGALALTLLATAAFRCPGADPVEAPDEGEGGAGGGGSTSSVASGTGGEGQGADGSGASGAGGDVGQGGCGSTDDDPAHCGSCGRACSLDGVDVAACTLGVCTSSCTSGRTNFSTPPAPDPDDGCEREGRRVFVTSSPVEPAFGGVSGADALCAALAEANALGGTWRAWLSDAGGSPAEDFVRGPEPYLLLDATLVAESFEDLTDFGIARPIDMGEDGLSLPEGVDVWTNTQPDGIAGDLDCDGWTSAAPSAQTYIGRTDQIDARWTYDPTPFGFCGAANAHLYCFEQ